MATVTLVLLMLLGVVLSSLLARLLPAFLPLPLVQIGLGAAIGFGSGLAIPLHPDLFFLLFLPPLLFLGGWRTSRTALLENMLPVVHLTLGLVVFTVVGVGFAIHWMVPSMPLPVAFALSAVLSPTDAAAVTAIAERYRFPTRLLRIIQGEALLNDASGLVCLRFAIAAALTGSFSLVEATRTFLWLAVGGIAIGLATTLAIAAAKSFLARRLGEDTGNQILISALIPYAAYLSAEHFGASGILAAAAAGMTMNWIEAQGGVMAVTRVQRQAVWDALEPAVNGTIFVLLGEQLPTIFSGAARTVEQSGHHDAAWLAVYVVAIGLLLWLARFGWVWSYLEIKRLWQRVRGQLPIRPNRRFIAITACAGVRGAETLAGILTLPLVMPDGSAFLGRDLAIFLAAGAIILSLALAGIALPVLLRDLDLPQDAQRPTTERTARIQAARAAIQAIESAAATSGPDAAAARAAAARLTGSYQSRIEGLLAQPENAPAGVADAGALDRRLRVAGLHAERTELIRLLRTGVLDDDTMHRLLREVDLAETLLRDPAAV